MKKWIITASVVLIMVCASQASLIGMQGTFVTGSASFTYDGKTFQDGWAIRTYQSASATVGFDISILASYLDSTTVRVWNTPPVTFVDIVPKSMSFTDNSFIYSVLFDSATPTAGSGNYLLLDTTARNVGAVNAPNPPAAYTPGHEIPFSGTVQFEGQEWQPMAVPEPATMGLLGLGALALALRRKLRK